eukprot:gene9163-1251_t
MDAVLAKYNEIFTYDGFANHSIPWYMQGIYRDVIPFSAIVVYLFALWILPKIVPKGGMNVKPIMAVWNLLLSLMSGAVVICCGVGYAFKIQEFGAFTLFCDKDQISYRADPIAFWGTLFVWSKFAELFDTILTILKKPQGHIEFLHWYHHVTVLLFTWYCVVFHMSTGFIFATVNATVHTFMYWYYFKATIGQKPTWGMALTLLQISQMFVGLGVNGYYAYLYFNGVDCGCDEPGIVMAACGVIYFSYLLLFVQFFLKKYFGIGVASKDAKKTEKKSQ